MKLNILTAMVKEVADCQQPNGIGTINISNCISITERFNPNYQDS
jgi:hypothetical protein